VAEAPARRRALVWIVRGLSAGLAALYTIPALRYLAGRRGSSADEAVDVGAFADLPDGVPQRCTIRSKAADGWTNDAGMRSAIFLVRRGAEVHALDTTCPHTGCAVDWDASQTKFRCPCHKSEFAVDGERVSGPAPRGLDAQEVDVRGGRVRVRYRRYRAGRPDRVPV